MTIYNFYIFDRAGQCLVFRNWTHNTASTSTSSSSSSSSSSAASQAAVRKIESRKKLVFGLLHSMKVRGRSLFILISSIFAHKLHPPHSLVNSDPVSNTTGVLQDDFAGAS